MSSDDLIFLLKVQEKDKSVIKSSYITNDQVCSTVKWRRGCQNEKSAFYNIVGKCVSI